MKSIIGFFCAMLLAGCSASFPEGGEPSKFDGFWSGDLPAVGNGCSGLKADGEVRNGYLIADVTQNGLVIGEVWGPIDNNGRLTADIGRSGVSVGSADVTFSTTRGRGVWANEHCDGEVEIARR